MDLNKIDPVYVEALRDCIEDVLTALTNLCDTLAFEKSKRWLNRKQQRSDYNSERKTKGFFFTRYLDLRADEKLFFQYIRMDAETFDHLYSLTEPYFIVLRQRSDRISSKERLLVTLRYLASGDDIFGLAVSYRIGVSTLIGIIKETCDVIHSALSEVYLRRPDRVAWRNIATGFYNEWNLPNCIGAVDGKHIPIKAPPGTGSLLFNYKKYYSIHLMACCNHRYEFTCVGAFGGESDGGVFNRSEFGKAFNNGTLGIPTENPNLPNSQIKTPYYLVGDEAFRMTKNFMRPYSGRHLDDDKRIFNYRLSRARRCIENAFGILGARWAVLNKRSNFLPPDLTTIVLACLCLHNFLMSKKNRSKSSEQYCPENYTDTVDAQGNITQQGQWRNEVPDDSCFLFSNDEIVDDANVDVNNDANANVNGNVRDACAVRDALKDYLMTLEGKVAWQDDYINRGRNRDDGN